MIAVITAMEVELENILSAMEQPRPVEKPGLRGYIGRLHGHTVIAAVCGVGKVCAVNRVPFAVLRCISDLANDEAHGDYASFERRAAQTSADILCEAIRLMGAGKEG